MRQLATFTELKQVLASEWRLYYLGVVKKPASNKLYEFSHNGTETTHILKELSIPSQELDFYRDKLSLINEDFEVLQLPELHEILILPDKAYILLPYYDGVVFDFYDSDAAMTEQMVSVVKDLMKIDVENVIIGGNKFDNEQYEYKFWHSFEKAHSLELIPTHEKNYFKKRAEEILVSGRDTQRMIISNGDFNPRNLIRLGSKLVLIDWSQTVAPLEHHLTYPWLLNFSNPKYPNWQKEYATRFESEIPVNIENIRYHLMWIALIRAVAEKKHYMKLKDRTPLKMANNYLSIFKSAIKGFSSLVEIST